MAKALKDILEVYAPRSKDEKRFRDKHVVARDKLDDPSQDDAVFNATNIKTINRDKTKHGYDSNKDESVYESIHSMALHVKPVKVNGKTKYKVHAVGSHLEDGIKVGEHLSDTQLDDASEMGAKIKHLKEDTLDEKHLTPAEMKARERIAKGIEKSNPGMPMGKKMAIATSKAKEVAEASDPADEKLGKLLDPKMKTPNLDNYRKSNAPQVDDQRFVERAAATADDVRGQRQYKERTSGGLRNKVKDILGLDKPSDHYGPKQESYEGINESESSHKSFQEQHNMAAKHIKGITKALSDHYNNVTSDKNYSNGEAQWHHVSAIKNINRALEDLHHTIAREVDYSRPPKAIKEDLDESDVELLNIVYNSLTAENKAILEDIMDNNPDQLLDFLDQLEVQNG